MNRSYLWLIWVLVYAGCQTNKDLQDLPSLSWEPIDSIFAFHLEKGGDHLFHTGDLLGIEFVGGIDKKSNRFIPLSRDDSGYAALLTKLAGSFLNKLLDKKIGKNAEGYIKADLFRLFPDQRVTITAYLKDFATNAELDSLEKHIGEMPEVSEQRYISKEEAKKEFIAAGNADFSSVLDSNPLPAALAITVREDYCTPELLDRLKEKVEILAAGIISGLGCRTGCTPS